VQCTCDEKKTAAQISGHTWNIINNRGDQEPYLMHARNNDHYIDDTGQNTSHWFEKEMRVDLDGDGVIDCVDSSNVQETMIYPAADGKESAHLRARQVKQLCQASAPRDYGRYHSARQTSVAPPTPERPGMFGRQVQHQDKMRDVPEKTTPRVVDKQLFSARRGESKLVAAPPHESDMFRNLHQLRAESHHDVTDQQFAEALNSARRGSALAASGAAVCDAPVTRSSMVAASVLVKGDLPPKQAHERAKYSKMRVEPHAARDMTGWPFHHQDRLKREDPYYVKPVQQTGSSGVKYDIITGEGHGFWY